MSSDFLESTNITESGGVHDVIERQIRNRLRLAQRIAVEETGAHAPEIVIAVFEQLCFRYDEASPPVTH